MDDSSRPAARDSAKEDEGRPNPQVEVDEAAKKAMLFFVALPILLILVFYVCQLLEAIRDIWYW